VPINAAVNITTPVFLIVGEHDKRTPPEMSERIIAKLRGPKELWIVKDAVHGGAEGPEYINPPEFFKRPAAFYNKYL